MSIVFRSAWQVAAAAVLVVVCLAAGAQGAHRHVDEKGRVTYSDVPQVKPAKPTGTQVMPADAVQARPVQAGSGTQYQPTGPVIDYSGRYSATEPYGFKSSGKSAPLHVPEKSLDQRIEEKNARQAKLEREAKEREQANREKAIEQDRARVEREARLRLENDKRKLRELSRENDRR